MKSSAPRELSIVSRLNSGFAQIFPTDVLTLQQAAPGVLPAHQRLGARELVAAANHRLPVQRELAARERAAQLVLQPQPPARPVGESGHEEAERAAAALLGVVQRGFGALQQLRDVAPVAGIEAGADRSADGERGVADRERPREHRGHALRGRRVTAVAGIASPERFFAMPPSGRFGRAPPAATNANADAACPDGNDGDAGIGTCRAGDTRAAVRSGRARRPSSFTGTLTTSELTATAPMAVKAVRRPEVPPSAAMMPPTISHSFEWSAAFDSRRSGSSSVGVGVHAIARYVARSSLVKSPRRDGGVA